MFFRQNLNFEFVLTFFIKAFLLLFPWQTIWLYREVFIGGFKYEYATLGFYATEGLLWVIVVLFMTWYYRRWKFQISNFKFQITSDRIFVFSCLLFTIYCLLSTVWSADKSLAWQQATRVMEAFLLFFILFLGPLDFKSAVKWLVMGAVLPCLLGIWQFVSQSAPASSLLGLTGHAGWEGGASIVSGDKLGRILRAYGTFSHPNVFGGYLAIVIVTLLHCYIVKVGKEKQVMTNLNFFISYSLFLIPLFLTFSRSALLALPIIWLIYFLAINKLFLEKIKGLFYLVFPALLLVMILIPVLSVRMSNDSIYETRSINERMTGYHEAWQIIKQHPLLGVGTGNYTVALWRLDKWRPIWEIQPVHNVFLLMLAELGVVGMGLWLLMIVSFIKFHESCSMNHESRICCLSVICFMFYVICYMILAMFDHYLYSSYIGLALTAVFFGLLIKSGVQDSHS